MSCPVGFQYFGADTRGQPVCQPIAQPFGAQAYGATAYGTQTAYGAQPYGTIPYRYGGKGRKSRRGASLSAKTRSRMRSMAKSMSLAKAKAFGMHGGRRRHGRKTHRKY